jgi:hypothetical protein
LFRAAKLFHNLKSRLFQAVNSDTLHVLLLRTYQVIISS